MTLRLLSLKTDRLDAEALCNVILDHAKQKDLDSAVVVDALAQVLAMLAAQMDVQGIGVASTIDERMGTLADRVKELHRYWLARMQSAPMVGNGRA
jgi:uncharacterized protein YlxW (UPF0749 family)